LGEASENPRVSAGPIPASRVGKYELVELLGKGAMGAVYLAHDPLLDRDVALKVMLPQIADDPEQKQRFEREARAVARMMHRNVVMVFDLGYHTDGSPYIVMELLRGSDLFRLQREGPPLSLETKLAIVLEVLEGLGHAHKVGIVHRDIKPANIFITEDGTAKIMDFGVARLAAASMTASGVVLGTANYMSPEQVVGGSLDGRSDLFSVGCMLCELLSGRRPFDGESVMTTLYKIAHHEPNIELPAGPEYEGLRPILGRALAKNVEERFATSAEFKVALRTFLERPRLSTPPSAPQPPAALSTAEETIAAPRSASSPTLAPESTLERPDPTRLFRLLREIYVQGKSGHLHFTQGRARRSLRILKGQILHGTSDVTGEHLGDVMVRYGFLSQSDLERAVAVVLAQRKRLGAVLAELGLASGERLEEAVGLHVREILSNALGQAGGSCLFEEVAESILEMELASTLSTGEVILEATRRVQDPDLVRGALGDTGRVVCLSNDPLLRSQKITLTPTDGFLLSRIDGTLSAREVMSLIPLPAVDTERSLFGLLCTGIVDYQQKPARVRPSPPHTGPFPTRVASDGPPPTAAPLPRARPEANELRRMILEAHEGIRLKDHFELLGVPRGATESEVKEAYAGFARLLHPDACRDPALADLTGKREAVFVRLCEAYEVLRDPISRTRYESEFPARRARLATPGMDASTGVTSRAPESDVPVPAREAAEASVASSRTDKDREFLAGADDIRTGEQLLEKEKYWDAIQQLEKGIPRVRGQLRLRARVALARAYMKNPKWLKRAEQVLQATIGENPRYAEAYVVLGSLYGAGQLLSRASAMYRKALQLEPGHPQARAALASLEEPSEAGPLRRLFKRA
jgi:serine/threonine-protein kinase